MKFYGDRLLKNYFLFWTFFSIQYKFISFPHILDLSICNVNLIILESPRSSICLSQKRLKLIRTKKSAHKLSGNLRPPNDLILNVLPFSSLRSSVTASKWNTTLQIPESFESQHSVPGDGGNSRRRRCRWKEFSTFETLNSSGAREARWRKKPAKNRAVLNYKFIT